jgi:hypothetical protein
MTGRPGWQRDAYTAAVETSPLPIPVRRVLLQLATYADPDTGILELDDPPDGAIDAALGYRPGAADHLLCTAERHGWAVVRPGVHGPNPGIVLQIPGGGTR